MCIPLVIRGVESKLNDYNKFVHNPDTSLGVFFHATGKRILMDRVAYATELKILYIKRLLVNGFGYLEPFFVR